MLRTVEDALKHISRRLDEVQRLAQEAMDYAESSARLHHAAICRLNQLATGEYHWPRQDR